MLTMVVVVMLMMVVVCTQDRLVNLVQLEHVDSQVLPDPLDQWALLDLQVHKATLDHRDLWEPRCLELSEQLVLPDLLVKLDSRDFRDPADHKVGGVNQDSREPPDQRDDKDHRDSLDSLDLRAKRAVLDRLEVEVCAAHSLYVSKKVLAMVS